MADLFQFERDRAYDALVDVVLGGGVSPTEPLSERRLAESLGIGRTPVREAMRDLARDGILEVRPARGTYVRSLSAEDVREIYEVRQGLEGLAASMAARRGATPALSAYGQVFREMIERPDAHSMREMYEVGARFHLEIFRASGNRQLLQIYEPLRLRFRLALALPRFFDHGRVRESIGEHLAVLEAIENGEEAAAQQLISEHLTKGWEARSRIFADLAAKRPQAPLVVAATRLSVRLGPFPPNRDAASATTPSMARSKPRGS